MRTGHYWGDGGEGREVTNFNVIYSEHLVALDIIGEKGVRGEKLQT